MKINDQTISEQFTTSDLGLAAVLVGQGHRLLDVDRSNPRRVLFCFSEIQNIDELSAKFWSRQLLVDACSLVENMKALKGRIYAG